VAAVTSLFSVGVVPSIEGEGSNAAIKEAMALGVPVVASALPGNTEVLAGCGLETAAADPLALADAVNRLLSDQGLRDELGRRGADRVEAFRPSTMVDGALLAYHELVAGASLTDGSM
jgi:glycosyltransferase involved in cell wall biosynthesis